MVETGLLHEETLCDGCFGERSSDQCVGVLSATRHGLVSHRLPHPFRIAVFRPEMSVSSGQWWRGRDHSQWEETARKRRCGQNRPLVGLGIAVSSPVNITSSVASYIRCVVRFSPVWCALRERFESRSQPSNPSNSAVLANGHIAARR